MLMASACASAGEWHQSVSLPTSLEYDSNLPLSATNKKGVSRLIVVPTYDLVGTFGVDEFKAGLGLNIERSSDQITSMNREDPKFLLGWRRLTETGEFGLITRYEEASTRASELLETGLVVNDSTRKTKSLAGNWRTAISELSTLTTDAEYKAVAYDAGTLTNFNNLSAGITWGYAWSERIEPFVRFAVSHYDPEKKTATVVASDNYTVTGGVKLKTSEQMEWTVQGGSNTVSAGATNTSWQGSFAMQYLADRYDVAFNMGRSVSASGEGGFVESDLIKGTLGYVINERSRAGVGATWQDNKGAIPNTMQLLDASVSHELSPFWSARLYYQHKLRSQNGQPDASGDLLGLTFVYSHPDF